MTDLSKKKTLELLKQTVSENLKDNQSLQSVYFATENILDGRVGLPVTVRYMHTAKTGRKTEKKDEFMFFPPFDPFTGEKTTA